MFECFVFPFKRTRQVIEDFSHPLWTLSVAINVDDNAKMNFVPKRFLNPGTYGDLYILYQTETLPENQVSQSVFMRVYHQRWEKFIGFRDIGQGKRCKECARLDEERTLATSTEERAEVSMRKRRHVDEVMADRQVSIRANRIAEQDAAKPTVDGIGQLLKLTIDGMDQAKFRCPRNLKSSAEFDSLFRPQLHVVGCIAHGHIEAYFVMNGDQAKDASMNCTVISRMLDLVKEKIGPQCALPRSLLVAADNTTRESKNQIFANFMAMMPCREVFEDDAVQFLRAGHTHNELDQRFSTVAAILSHAPTLEDPQDSNKVCKYIIIRKNQKIKDVNKAFCRIHGIWAS